MLKTKYLIFEPIRKAGSFVNKKLVFVYIGGNATKIVNQWPLLDYIIDNRSDDGADISFRRNSL